MNQHAFEFPIGSEVLTTAPNQELRKEWTEVGWNSRQWGVSGSVVDHHDSHGEVYDVCHHADGTIGAYGPSEITHIRSIAQTVQDVGAEGVIVFHHNGSVDADRISQLLLKSQLQFGFTHVTAEEPILWWNNEPFRGFEVIAQVIHSLSTSIDS